MVMRRLAAAARMPAQMGRRCSSVIPSSLMKKGMKGRTKAKPTMERNWAVNMTVSVIFHSLSEVGFSAVSPSTFISPTRSSRPLPWPVFMVIFMLCPGYLPSYNTNASIRALTRWCKWIPNEVSRLDFALGASLLVVMCKMANAGNGAIR